MALSAEDKRLLEQMKANRAKKKAAQEKKPKAQPKSAGSLSGASKRALEDELGIKRRLRK